MKMRNPLHRVADWFIRKLIAYRRPDIEVTGPAIKTDQVCDELRPKLCEGGRLDAQDISYQRIESEWLNKESKREFEKLLYWLSADEVKFTWDCDDRAILWWIWVKWLYSFIEDPVAQSPYAIMEKHKVPGHAAGGAGTERGVEWFDAQLGVTGEPQEIYDIRF